MKNLKNLDVRGGRVHETCGVPIAAWVPAVLPPKKLLTGRSLLPLLGLVIFGMAGLIAAPLGADEVLVDEDLTDGACNFAVDGVLYCQQEGGQFVTDGWMTGADAPTRLVFNLGQLAPEGVHCGTAEVSFKGLDPFNNLHPLGSYYAFIVGIYDADHLSSSLAGDVYDEGQLQIKAKCEHCELGVPEDAWWKENRLKFSGAACGQVPACGDWTQMNRYIPDQSEYSIDWPSTVSLTYTASVSWGCAGTAYTLTDGAHTWSAAGAWGYYEGHPDPRPHFRYISIGRDRSSGSTYISGIMFSRVRVTQPSICDCGCQPGATETEPCGDCGTRTRTCSSGGSWLEWSTCAGPDPGDGTTACQTGLPGICAEGVQRCIDGSIQCESTVSDLSQCSAADEEEPEPDGGAATDGDGFTDDEGGPGVSTINGSCGCRLGPTAGSGPESALLLLGLWVIAQGVVRRRRRGKMRLIKSAYMVLTAVLIKSLACVMIILALGAGMPSCGGCGGQSLVGEPADADMPENGNLDDSEGDAAEELHDDLEDLSEMEQQGGCGEPIVLTGAAELNRLLSGLDWPVVGPYTSAHLPITPDMKVEGSLELSGDDFLGPPGCFPDDGCRDRVFFYVDDVSDIEGVTTVGSDEEMPWIEDYPAVILTDTLVRFRPMLYDVHPAPHYVVVSAIEILPSCESPCREGESRCPVDGVCYWVEGWYCQLCEALGKETCACWTPDGPVPDGSDCVYMRSGDVACMGTCEGGICASDWDLCH